MKKILALAMALVLVLSATSAMAVTVGFSQIGAESDWRTANTDDVLGKMEAAGFDVVYDDAMQQQQNQVKALRNFITQGVDYIVFTAIVTTGWDEVLQEVIDEEIPLILIDRFPETQLGEDFYVTFMGSDFPEEGRRAGRWIMNYMDSVGRGADEINIVELQGTTGADAATGRYDGIREALEGHDNYKIVASQTGNFTRAEGQAVMESFLKSVDKIDVLWAHNDDMALGAIDAIKAAGLKPGEDIIIVSADAVKAAFEAIVAGELNCTIECSPLLGGQVVEVINALEGGETVNKRTITIEGAFDMVGGIEYADGLETIKAADVIDERAY